MSRNLFRNPKITWMPAWAALLAVLAGPVFAQVDHMVVDEEFAEAEGSSDVIVLRTAEELEDLAAPIALYPDDLVSIILPAATYPVQIVQAARFLDEREGNPALQPPEDWDDAVVALLNYPEIVDMLNEDLDWTWALGEAFLNQQSEVLAAVAAFREEAYAAGNLKSDQHQVVRRTERVIEIVPADPEVIYVPYYEPERVIVYQPYPVYHYHPYPRYSYYYPYPANYGFSFGYFFGVSTAYRLRWVDHSLYTFHYGYHGHPYYGRGYHHRFYYRHRPYPRHRPKLSRSQGHYAVNRHHGDRWKPRKRHGHRPLARAGAEQRGRRHQAGNRGVQDRSRLAANSPARSRPHSSARSYSDKNREQRRLINSYRENARSGARATTDRSRRDHRSNLASVESGGSAARRAASADSARQSRQVDAPNRGVKQNQVRSRENAADTRSRARPEQRRTATAARELDQRRTAAPASRARHSRQADTPTRIVRQNQVRSRENAAEIRGHTRPNQRRATTAARELNQKRTAAPVSKRAASTRHGTAGAEPRRQVKAQPGSGPIRAARPQQKAARARAEDRPAPAREKRRADTSRREGRRR